MDGNQILKDIKKSFLVFRNGIISDTLRKAGMPYKVIFGLQVPQLASISRMLHNEQLNGMDNAELTTVADMLWNDREVRESRLLAPYIYESASVAIDKAKELAADIRTREEADMLAFRLFKRLPYREKLLSELEAAGNTLAASALRAHLS